MRIKEMIPSLVWVIIGVTISIASYSLKLGSWRHPGSGVYPFLIGSIIFLLSFPQFIIQLLKKSETEELWHDIAGLKRIIVVFIVLVFYALSLEGLGFILCTFVSFVSMFKILGRRGWGYAILTSFLVAVLTYIVFHIWLKLNLPIGPFGI
jgi:hypothetical protein